MIAGLANGGRLGSWLNGHGCDPHVNGCDGVTKSDSESVTDGPAAAVTAVSGPASLCSPDYELGSDYETVPD